MRLARWVLVSAERSIGCRNARVARDRANTTPWGLAHRLLSSPDGLAIIGEFVEDKTRMVSSWCSRGALLALLLSWAAEVWSPVKGGVQI